MVRYPLCLESEVGKIVRKIPGTDPQNGESENVKRVTRNSQKPKKSYLVLQRKGTAVTMPRR